MRDVNGEECLIVVKNGNATDVTIGRATGIESFVREYNDCGNSLDVHGDSHPSVQPQGRRIVGILTGSTNDEAPNQRMVMTARFGVRSGTSSKCNTPLLERKFTGLTNS
ncbi:uncharacterized protein EI90DRAFT_3017168 [Cantharellus anzutake]|uniref:uncharacterized protein n=1 Tax=Cantharellus anzutake TaxID=1750568 RepID=UPI0019033414|nr:uncharacterized protein EI90DRAFT_3017168 [Cantharellus anzutake]KAF8329369.1 hypothetical protein EI90DRAFT_3017168 [Cantharellus anzutake]